MKKSKISWEKENIKALRKHLGKTQAEFATDMGIRQQTVSEWEIGMYEPRGTSSTLLSIIAEKANFKYSAKK
jgi:DNA-binding transcriptional regulator YiaG